MIHLSRLVFPHLGISCSPFGPEDTVGEFDSGAWRAFGIGEVDLQIPVTRLFGHEVKRDFQGAAFGHFPFGQRIGKRVSVGKREPLPAGFVFERDRGANARVEVPFAQIRQAGG